MLFLIIQALCLAVKASPKAPEDGRWRAAVYEHQLVTPASAGCTLRTCTREEAIQVISSNLGVLTAKVGEAAREGAELILLPEDGIHGYGFTRETIPGFLEPLLGEGENPCQLLEQLEDDGEEWEAWYQKYYAQVTLSCAARDNSMYVVAALGSVAEGKCNGCGSDHGPDCFFNTAVVYDPSGYLVAHYHKYNLWTSELPIYDIDPTPQVVVVDTPLGRLGLAICEDLLWKSPVINAAEDAGMDTLLMPLSWWDMFPHQLAHSNEDAWARSLQINLLAANNHVPLDWNSGSGIFTPSGHAAVYHNVTEGSRGQLLIADLDIHPSKSNVDWPLYAQEHVDDFEKPVYEFEAVVYNDTYKFVPLDPLTFSAKVCWDEEETFCCLADYIADAFYWNDVFSLGIFSGSHTKDGSVSGSFYIEMCTIMKCNPRDIENTCDHELIKDYNYLSTSNTLFQKLELSGSFSSTTHVFPEVLFTNTQLLPDQVEITNDGRLSLGYTPHQHDPLLSMSLFGRRYEGDSPQPDQFCPGGEN